MSGTTEQTYMSADEVRLGAGKFDAENLYLVKSAAAGSFHVAGGRTIRLAHIQHVAIIGGNQHILTWRYSVGGYVVEKTTDANDPDVPTSRFNAETTRANVL